VWFGAPVQHRPDTLVMAVAFGSPDDVSVVLQFGAYSLNTCMRPLGMSPLHVAVTRGSLPIVKLLLAAGMSAAPCLRACSSTRVGYTWRLFCVGDCG
jgi:hypothetical protein